MEASASWFSIVSSYVPVEGSCINGWCRVENIAYNDYDFLDSQVCVGVEDISKGDSITIFGAVRVIDSDGVYGYGKAISSSDGGILTWECD